MDLSFFPLTLEAVDQAAAESLCLFIGADERPLTGLAGLADWRLSGKLSRLLRNGLLTGDAGEAVLTPPPGSRLAFQKLFLFGMGRAEASEEELAGCVAEAVRKLAEAGVQEAALQLPARLAPDEGIRLLLEQPNGPRRAMLFGPEPQKLIAALSQVASRGQANLERRVVRVPTPPPLVKTPAKPQAAQKPPSIPKASPLPFAPQGDLPPPGITAPPPPAIPRASPLPFAPAEPLPAGPTAEPPIAPAVPASEPPEEASQPEPEKQPPPGPQRYVPPPPKPSVFDSKRKKKH